MKKLILFVVALLFLNKLHAQDELLLGPYQSLLSSNPSFAGSNGGFRGQFIYRDYSENFSGSTTSIYGGVDAYVKKLHGGLAVSANMNKQSNGAYQSSAINLIYAPIFECKESGLKITPSLQLTYFQRKVDYAKINFTDKPGFLPQWTPDAYPTEKKNFDASAGLLLSYKNFYAGASIFHFNQPDEGVFGASKLPARLSLNASYNLPINENTLLNFSGVFNRQSKFVSLHFAANAIFIKHLMLGLVYGGLDLASLNLGYRNNYFSAGATYGANLSKLSDRNYHSWQLYLGLSLHKKMESTTLKNFENW